MTDAVLSPLDTDLSVHVDRLVSQPVGHLWEIAISPAGVEAWLGAGAVLGGKGEHWFAADGTLGVLRSYHAGEQIRVSWHAGEDAPATLVDLHVSRVDDSSTSLEIVHGHLYDGLDRDWLADHWNRALERIDNDAL